MIHFGTRELYVGLAYWARATKLPTTQGFPKQGSDKGKLKEAMQKFKHVAPECFSSSPTVYSKAQDVYSISYHIHRLL